MKIIHKKNLFPNFDFIAFHTNLKQYLDTFYKQMKKEMHIRMHNYDFIYSSEVSNIRPKCKTLKTHKNLQKIKCYLYKTSWEFVLSYKLY